MNELIGKRIGNYRIDALLGEGGMGSVYRAWDLNLARPVAIKVMHPQFARQNEFQMRFLQEAKAPAGLNHPSIVHIYQFGAEHGQLFIVMEFVPGSTLSNYIKMAQPKNQVLDLRESLVLISQVASALDYAHRRGIIHRDIKPDNILLWPLDRPDREGDPPVRAAVTDFGLAKLLEGGVQTQTGTFMGTLPYMSPEQALGKEIDSRTDVYSLGVVLYQVTTGRLPFDIRSPTDAILKHQKETPPPPRQVQPGIPEQVEAIIQKAIAKEPNDRYASAAEMQKALLKAADHLTTDEVTQYAPPESVISIVTQEQKRPRMDASAAVLEDFQEARIQPGVDLIQILIPGKTIQQVRLKPGSMKVGRNPENDIVLNDPLVSRSHAVIEFDGTRCWVIDQNTANGTYMGDARLLPGVREAWDASIPLAMGGCYLRLVQGKPAQPRPATVIEEFSESQIRGRIGIFLTTNQFKVEPGSSCVIKAVILNQGTFVDHFQVSLSGVPDNWLASQPPVIQLMPAVQQDVELTVQPPEVNTRAGEYPLVIRATSRVNPEDSVEIHATLHVTPRYQLGLELRPQRQRSTRAGQFTVIASNRGNADLEVRFTAADPEQACQFSITPAQTRVPAGRESEAQLRIETKQPLSSWSGRVYPFTVTGQLAEDPLQLQQVRGEWEQAPPSIEVSLRPQKLRSTGRGAFTLQVSNRVDSPVKIHVEAIDPEELCRYEISPDEVELPANEDRYVTLKVIPKVSLQPGKTRTVPFTLTTRLADAPLLTRQLQGVWEEVFPTIDLALQPAEIRGQSGNFQLQVSNRSEMELLLQITGETNQPDLEIQANPTRLLVSPNSDGYAQITAKPNQPWYGPGDRTWPVAVSVSLAEETTRLGNALATLVQLPIAKPATAPKPAPERIEAQPATTTTTTGRAAAPQPSPARAAAFPLPEPVKLGLAPDANPAGVKPVLPPEEVTAQKSGARWPLGCLVALIGFLITAIAGFAAGQWVSVNFYDNTSLPMICASAVWITGGVLSLNWAFRAGKKR